MLNTIVFLKRSIGKAIESIVHNFIWLGVLGICSSFFFLPAPLPINGYWDGYFYENGKEIMASMHIVKNGDAIEGAMSENRGTVNNIVKVKSKLKGTRDGKMLKLEKTYTNFKGSNTETQLIGKIDQEGIVGRWSNNSNSGMFKFHKAN